MSTTAALAAVPATVAAPSIAQSADAEEHAAVLARAEQMVDILRTCHVREGFHEAFKAEGERVERFLKYFRDCAAGVEDDAAYDADVRPFMRDYGQSFDWILDGNPVGMIVAAAATAGSDQLATLYLEFIRAAHAPTRSKKQEAARLDTMDALEHQILALPCVSARDLAIKMEVYSCEGLFELGENFRKDILKPLLPETSAAFRTVSAFEHRDAELIRLGEEIAALAKEYEPLRQEERRCYLTIESEIVDACTTGDIKTRDRRLNDLYKRSGYRAARRRAAPIAAKLVDRLDAALALNFSTLDGLAAQLKAISASESFHNADLPPDVQRFLGRVAAFAGVDIIDLSDEVIDKNADHAAAA